jgi:hypothetical protein
MTIGAKSEVVAINTRYLDIMRRRPPLAILLLLCPLLAATSLLEEQYNGANSGLRSDTLDPSPMVSFYYPFCGESIGFGVFVDFDKYI